MLKKIFSLFLSIMLFASFSILSVNATTTVTAGGSDSSVSLIEPIDDNPVTTGDNAIIVTVIIISIMSAIAIGTAVISAKSKKDSK